jgi:Protein of unknown function (DUF3102)
MTVRLTPNSRRLRRSRVQLPLDNGGETKTELMALAERISAEHKAASEAFNNGFKHAIKAGNLLIEAKAKLKHGGWMAWLNDHCRVAARTAQSICASPARYRSFRPGKRNALRI